MQVSMNLGAHKRPYRVVFPSCSRSKISLGLCSSLEFLFSILWQEIWVFIDFSLACTSCNFTHVWSQAAGGQREKKVHQWAFAPHWLGTMAIANQRGRFPPSLSILGTSLLTQLQWGTAYWQGCERMEKRTIGVLPYSLWTSGGLFSALPGALSVQSLSPSGFGLPWVQPSGYRREKIVNSLPVVLLQILVLFLNLPGTINC